MDIAAAVEALLTVDGRRDPYPFYDVLRDAGPVVPVSDSYVIACGYEVVERVLRDPAFLVEDAELLDGLFPGWRERPSVALLINSMLNVNSPDHERMRRLVTRAFTARRVAELRPAVQQRAAELADRLAELGGGGAPVDFMAEFAYPLPVAVIADLLGVPEADRAWFRPRAIDLTASLEMRVEGAQLDVADRAAVELAGYFTDLVAERRRQPRADLISALVETGDGLSEVELIGNLALLLVAGFETTTNLLGNGLVVLFDHGAAAARLRSQPQLAPAYVEELLRFDSPVQLTSRWSRSATVLDGVPLAASGQVLVLLGAANRDPRRFPDPDRFDPERAGNAPVSFGGGGHFCLGAALARLEAQVAFPLLLDRFAELRPAGPPVRRDRLTLRGYATVPVTVGG